jgi:hypothetical protein
MILPELSIMKRRSRGQRVGGGVEGDGVVVGRGTIVLGTHLSRTYKSVPLVMVTVGRLDSVRLMYK